MNLQSIRKHSFCINFLPNNYFTYSTGDDYIDLIQTFILFTKDTHIITEELRFKSFSMKNQLDQIILQRTFYK